MPKKKSTAKKPTAKKTSFRKAIDEQHPFGEDLEVGNLTWFANRVDELKKLGKEAKRSRRIGIEGALGSGKSTFLKYFVDTKSKYEIAAPVAWIDLSSVKVEFLFRSIAWVVLANASNRRTKKGGQILLPLNDVNVREELLRLNNVPIETAFAVSLISDWLRIRKTKTKKTALHNESTAIHLLQKIVASAKQKFLIVLDDFHYLRPDNPGDSYLSELSELLAVLSNALNHKNLHVVLTLDERAKQKRIELAKAAGGVSLLGLNDLVELPPFGVAQLAELIHRRLLEFKWNGKLRDFIEEGALAILILGTNGNPRAMLVALKNATDKVYDKLEKFPISVQSIKESIEKTTHKSVDEVDAKIINFTGKKGGSAYASQSGFKEATGLSVSNINRRCKQLVERGILSVAITKVGKTRRNVYSLIIFDHSY